MAVTGTALAVSAAGAVAGAVISSVLAPKPKGQTDAVAAAAPTVAPVTPMPTADDSAVAAAKKKSIADQIATQGRASTILSQTSDSLG